MTVQCYMVERTSALETLFEELDNYGFDYECENSYNHNYIEIFIFCYPYEIKRLEEMMKWYV